MANAYDIVMGNRKELVNRLIEQMEKGYAETRAAWTRSGQGRPYNPISDAVYKGGNRFRLMIAAEVNGFTDPRWLTFKQADENNYKIKPGSKSVLLEKWVYFKEVPMLDENQQPVLDSNGKPLKEWEQLKHPVVNYFRVFNGEQVEGLPALEKKVLTEDKYSEMADTFERSSLCPIKFGMQDEAYYSLAKDEINLPAKAAFKSNKTRLAVQLHEMGHSTGHPERLNRPLQNTFGSEEYAKEELRAELSSIFMESELGIELEPDSESMKDHSNYLKSWISVLKNDPNELFKACADAEEITEFLMQNYEQTLQLEQENAQQVQLENAANEVSLHTKCIFETVVNDVQRGGVWGAWMGHVVNSVNPQEYFNIDMLGMERTGEVILDITCIKDGSAIAMNQFSISEKDIRERGIEAFNQEEIKEAFMTALEKGSFSLVTTDGKAAFSLYFPQAGIESLEKHRELLEISGKSHPYYTEASIAGDVGKSGFKATETLIENIRRFSELSGKTYTLKELSALHKTNPDFSKEPEKAKCFEAIIKECQEQEASRAKAPAHFMKHEMQMELTPTAGA